MYDLAEALSVRMAYRLYAAMDFDMGETKYHDKARQMNDRGDSVLSIYDCRTRGGKYLRKARQEHLASIT